MSTHLMDLDKRRKRLQARFPDWVIWYWAGKGLDDVTWFARPKPELRAESADELEHALRACEGIPA